MVPPYYPDLIIPTRMTLKETGKEGENVSRLVGRIKKNAARVWPDFTHRPSDGLPQLSFKVSLGLAPASPQLFMETQNI